MQIAQPYLIFKCERLHRFLNTKYQVMVTESFLTIQKKSCKPKYNYELSLSRTLYWYIQDSKLQAFGIVYKHKIKFFKADYKDLDKLREHCGAKILFDNISNLYKCSKFIDIGPDSKVYKIEDLLSHAYWGLKCTDNAKVFELEMKILTRLNHQNIIRVRECFKGEQYFYIVMELMNGTNLEQYLNKNPKLTHLQIRNVMHQLLKAVDYLHNNQIIHRDISPANIMFQLGGKPDNIKLVDFGNAVLTTQEVYPFPENATRNYMAPEIITSESKYNQKCDLFSCGSIMYRLYSGCDIYDSNGSCNLSSYEEEDYFQDIDLKPLYIALTPVYAIDLIQNLLNIHPNRRISAQEALHHNYFRTDSMSPVEKRQRFQSRQYFGDELKATVNFQDFDQDYDLDEFDAQVADFPEMSIRCFKRMN